MARIGLRDLWHQAGVAAGAEFVILPGHAVYFCAYRFASVEPVHWSGALCPVGCTGSHHSDSFAPFAGSLFGRTDAKNGRSPLRIPSLLLSPKLAAGSDVLKPPLVWVSRRLVLA